MEGSMMWVLSNLKKVQNFLRPCILLEINIWPMVMFQENHRLGTWLLNQEVAFIISRGRIFLLILLLCSERLYFAQCCKCTVQKEKLVIKQTTFKVEKKCHIYSVWPGARRFLLLCSSTYQSVTGLLGLWKTAYVQQATRHLVNGFLTLIGIWCQSGWWCPVLSCSFTQATQKYWSAFLCLEPIYNLT